MPNTIGFHLVKSCYGMWLPGDERGSWSDAWDDQIGFYQPHNLNPGDPIRERMAAERQVHPAVIITDEMMYAVADAIGQCVRKAGDDLRVAALGIDRTHSHILLHYSTRSIDNTAKWIADQTTKQIHRTTSHSGPVWCKGKWCGFIFDPHIWGNTIRYVERHNIRRGLPARPYDFLT